MQKSSGFTLIEMLVVVSIIAVLAALLVPMYTRSKERGYQVVCMSNQRQLAQTITIWAQDHDETYPKAKNVWTNLDITAKVLVCPTEENRIIVKGRNRGVNPVDGALKNDYVYSRFIAGRAIGAITSPSTELLTTDGYNHPNNLPLSPADNSLYMPNDIAYRHQDGAIASYCDGHVARFTETPPLWIIKAGYQAFKSEVEDTRSPVMAIVGPVDADTDVLTTEETVYLKLITTVVPHIAQEYRSRIKVVDFGSAHIDALGSKYGVVPGDYEKGYPVVLLMYQGRLYGQKTGYLDKDVLSWTPEKWKKELAAYEAWLGSTIRKMPQGEH